MTIKNDKNNQNLVSVGEIAGMLMITDRRVQQLTKEGILPKSDRGRYNLIQCVQAYIRYLRELAFGTEKGASNVDYGKERTRLVKARADLVEMEAAKIRGELVPAAEVQRSWVDLMTNVKLNMLALPNKVAPVLHEKGSAEEVALALKQEIEDALRIFATTDPGGDSPRTGQSEDGGATSADASAGSDN